MFSDPLTELSAADRARLEALLVDFDLRWSPDGLDRAVAQLPAGGVFRAAALREMVKIDWERHAARGRPNTVGDYVKRFPELAEPGQILLQFAELRETASDTAASAPVELPDPFGRYRILRPLGRGGMGSVFLARDTELDRLVALKVPHFRADDVEASERFAREARAAATIDHPNVCRVYDVGRVGDIPFLTMAFIDGPTLADEIQRGPIAERRAVGLVRDVARALAEAHRRGVIHRDLKPGNILIRSHDEPVVTDFGLARRDSENLRLTSEGVMLGTPQYMPPEQLTGDTKSIGPASDVYALGAVLYEALTGQPPFAGSRSDLFQQILTHKPLPPSSIRPGVTPGFDATVLKALAKSPGDRFASMDALAEALDASLRTDSPTRNRAPRRWILALTAITLTVSFVAIIVRWPAVEPKPGPDDPGDERPAIPKPRTMGAIAEDRQRLMAAVFSPDGSSVFTGATEPAYVHLRQWDASTGKGTAVTKKPLLQDWIVFAHDGRRFLAGGSHTAHLCRLESGEVIQSFATSPHARAGAFARDVPRIIIGGESLNAKSFAQVFESNSGNVVGSYGGHKEPVHLVAISDDGAWAYSASADRHVIWEVNGGTAKFDGGKNSIHCALFVPGTNVCIVGTVSGEISAMDPSSSSRALVNFADRHKDSVTCLAVAADGQLLLSGSADKSIRGWDVRAGTLKWELPVRATPTAIGASPDGKRLVITSSKTWGIWDIPGER